MKAWWDKRNVWEKAGLVVGGLLVAFLALGAIVGEQPTKTPKNAEKTKKKEINTGIVKISLGEVDFNYPATALKEKGVFNDNHRPFAVPVTVENGTDKEAGLVPQFSEKGAAGEWIDCVFDFDAIAESIAPRAEPGQTWKGLAVCGPLKPPYPAPSEFRITDFFYKPYPDAGVSL
jgi:hypothetical protein